MSSTARKTSSCLLRLVGTGAALAGLGLAAAALMVNAGELQVLFAAMAGAGLVIALAGGALLAVGALMGRGRAKDAAPSSSPEQQQLRDSQEFLAARSGKDRA